MAEVRDLSMANVDPETARRRAERASRRRQDQREARGGEPQSRRRQAVQQRDEGERQLEHQPSLRSILSSSDISSEDVQEEILQAIVSEGLLDGIDVDNLTPAQEEEVTERIAEVYRRRRRTRERSRNHEREERDRNSTQPDTQTSPTEGPTRNQPSPPQQPQTRSRPPISRPHLFEQPSSAGTERSQRRSASSTGQRSHSNTLSTNSIAPAARSATDLSVPPRLEQTRARPRASSNNARRSSTDPVGMTDTVQRVRATSNTLRPENARVSTSSRTRSRDSQQAEPVRRNTGVANDVSASQNQPNSRGVNNVMASTPQQSVRPAISTSAFAPELVPGNPIQPISPAILPSISCSRCQRPNIASQLHYNCSKCESGAFNLCLQCYRDGKGCLHWFGFGDMAAYRWQQATETTGPYPRGYELPHVLAPRRYRTKTTLATISPTSPQGHSEPDLEEGAFCELCFTFTNECYWYCNICLEGAWGYCNACVLRGAHCTHPLLALAHISTLPNASHDPSKLAFLPVPHLKPHSYLLSDAQTDCDVCARNIRPRDPRFHCYECEDGNYDICENCYHSLVATGKISIANGPAGWRKCLHGHRMAILGFLDTPHGGGQLRAILHEKVGGWRWRDDGNTSSSNSSQNPPSATQSSPAAPPPDGLGGRALAAYSWWPQEGVRDELAFPKNAEIREVEERNADWSVGVYAGRVGLFSTNYTRRI